MNIREASEALHVPGCIPGANRYYVVSGWLREAGWTGCGDRWSEPTPVGDAMFSFHMAAYLMGFDKEYTYLMFGRGVPGCDEDADFLSEYEWAWVAWAEEMELEEREMA